MGDSMWWLVNHFWAWWNPWDLIVIGKPGVFLAMIFMSFPRKIVGWSFRNEVVVSGWRGKNHRNPSVHINFVTVTCMKWTRGFPRIIFFPRWKHPGRRWMTGTFLLQIHVRNGGFPLYRWFFGLSLEIEPTFLAGRGGLQGAANGETRSYDPCQAVLAVKGLKDVSLEDVKGRTTEMGWGASYGDGKQRKKK